MFVFSLDFLIITTILLLLSSNFEDIVIDL